VRILHPETLRVPPAGSSAEGESGPKARPKGVVDGQRVNIPVPVMSCGGGRRRLSQPDDGSRFKHAR
jgi:hypothetical protein